MYIYIHTHTHTTKQSDVEAAGMRELWGMRSTSLSPSLLGPLWVGVGVPDRGVLSMGQIELIDVQTKCK